MADRYLELLSDFDLRVLGSASDIVAPDEAVAWFRAQSYRVTDALSLPETFAALCPPDAPSDAISSGAGRGSKSIDDLHAAERTTDGISVLPSPFLFFAALVQRGSADLLENSLVVERLGDRTFRRFDASIVGPSGWATAADPSMKLFITELLDSFTTARATSAWDLLSPARGGRRINERDPLDLIELLNRIDAPETPGVYRRLGDLSLFRCGLASSPSTEPAASWGPEALELLASSLPQAFTSLPFAVDVRALISSWTPSELLAELGPIWYRMAAHRLDNPVVATPLLAAADNFDDATAFIGHLRTMYHLQESSSVGVRAGSLRS